ncbi:outer membrane beta-barrel protein [Paraflavisolibacter sp. H34]|uniref:outer membrane beta-barrel protein n=1 Tax=Huijunlia imazamoxiresistens TaxID=3127457 RepID=UPI003017EFCB
MDELFRQAADSYPLKPLGADWEKVAARLKEGEGGAGGKKSRRFWGLMLLLLPLCFLLHTPLEQGDEGWGEVAGGIQKNFLPGASEPLGAKENKAAPATGRPVTASGGPVLSGPPKQTVPAPAESAILTQPGRTDRPVAGSRFHRDQKTGAGLSAQKPVALAVKNQAVHRRGAVPPVSGGQEPVEQAIASVPVTKRQKTDTVALLPADSLPIKEPSPVAADALTGKMVSFEIPGRKKFYAGVVVGPDLSWVKIDKVQGAGYSAGIIGGYRFAGKWAVEAGLLWDKKEYFAEGEHFNPAKMNLPAHTTILRGNGTCHMIEIPLTLRYTLASTGKHSWAAAAGVSSYLMKNEDYKYWYKRYSTSYYAYKEYRNASKNWFSELHLGVGYQRKLGNSLDMRIEPYLKLPLAGVGVGSLPLSSAGLHLGLTKSLR